MRPSANRSKIVEYIKKNLKKGYTIDSLKFALVNQGYSRTLIEDAIDITEKDLAKTAPVLKEKPIIRHEIIDEYNQPIKIHKPIWKKLLGL